MLIPRRSILVTGAFMLGAAIVTGPLLAQALSLKYTWPKGETLRYSFTSQSTVVMTGLPGIGDMTVDNTVVQVQSMVGDSVAADGVATVQVKIEAIKSTTAMPMMSIAYDSASPPAAGDPAAQLAAVFGPMIGATLTATIAPNGVVKSIEGMAKLKASTDAAAQAAAGLGISGAAIMSDEAMKAMYQNFASLPDKPAKTGDTWKTEFTQPNPIGAQTVSSTFTVKGVEKLEGQDVVRIGIVETIKTAPGGTMGPMSVQVGDATGQGDVFFNAKLGRLERCVIDVAMPLTMSLPAPDGSTMTLPASSKAKTTVELVRK